MKKKPIEISTLFISAQQPMLEYEKCRVFGKMIKYGDRKFRIIDLVVPTSMTLKQVNDLIISKYK